jgi:hypothetical protein
VMMRAQSWEPRLLLHRLPSTSSHSELRRTKHLIDERVSA